MSRKEYPLYHAGARALQDPELRKVVAITTRAVRKREGMRSELGEWPIDSRAISLVVEGALRPVARECCMRWARR